MDVAGARTQVLFITGANPMRGGGGLESYVRAHAHAANAAGFESHVFCVGRGARSTHESFGVVHQVAVPPHSPRGFLAGLYSPGVARAALAHLARVERGPVLIHAFGPYGCGGARIARSLERRGQHAVLVTSAYNTQEQENHAFLMGLRREHGLRNRVDYLTRYGAVRLIGTRNERRGYASSRLLLVNYESVRTLLRDEFGAGWEIRLMPYASDTAFATTDSVAVPEPVLALEPRAAPLIVSVSRHDPRKGVDVLLRALAELRDQGVGFRACLLGRGELIDAHRRLAANLRLDRSVAITDQVPDVVPYLRKADIDVLPSLSEASGSVSLLEALQAGVATVASDCDGIPEDVTDRDSALLVPPGDPHALAEAMRTLLGDRALRDRLGARAREVYEERFSAERFRAAVATLYSELGFTPCGPAPAP